jgi:hypothetical protein
VAGTAVIATSSVVLEVNPEPFTVSAAVPEPASTDVGEIEVIAGAAAVVDGGGVVDPDWLLEPEQPVITGAAHKDRSKAKEDQQYFMRASQV